MSSHCANSEETTLSVADTPVPPRPTAGVDWATDDHAVAVVDGEGEPIARFSITHNTGVGEVGIERPDGPVVDASRQVDPTVYPIPPGQPKNLRSHYDAAGNKDDRSDADVVRTDRRRLRPPLVDAPATTTLRQTVQARKDLVNHRVAVANQLRAHLQIVLPGAVGLFTDIDSTVSLRFLERFTTQTRTDWLTVKR